MDLVHDRASAIAQEEEEEDKISKLSDDIIHRILGFLDMKYAIQTCKLSRRWKHIWTSMPHLNLDSDTFGSLSLFDKFVKRALSHRNNGREVSSVKLTVRGAATQFAVKSIVNYAYSHSVRQLVIVWITSKRFRLPQHLFTSHTLKHLTLSGFNNHVPKTAWDFPSLETLNLSTLRFGEGKDEDKSLNLFSKCINLKDLTLHCCTMSNVHIFNVCAPKLLNLSITGSESFPKVFNVITPQLENFTASVVLFYTFDFLPLSTDGLDSLEKVKLSSLPFHNTRRFISQLLDLFQKVRSAKFLILDMWISETLSLNMDQISHKPSPFINLKCLKIDMMTVRDPMSSLSIQRRDRITKMEPRIRNYLLENSPGDTFIKDLPQLPPMPVKRPRNEVHNNTMTNKLAKLDVHSAPKLSLSNVPHQISTQEARSEATTKKMANLEAVEKQPETISEVKRMLEARIEMQDRDILKQKAMFEVKIQMQYIFIAKLSADYRAKIEMQDKVIVEQSEKIQMQDEVITKQKRIIEAKTQMVEAVKLQHEKLMSLIIKSKIAELKVKIEGGNPDHEVIPHSTGFDLKSVMDLIPESLRVKLEARFSSMYEGFKSLFFTHIDDSHWAKIETELEKEYKGFLD